MLLNMFNLLPEDQRTCLLTLTKESEILVRTQPDELFGNVYSCGFEREVMSLEQVNMLFKNGLLECSATERNGYRYDRYIPSPVARIHLLYWGINNGS